MSQSKFEYSEAYKKAQEYELGCNNNFANTSREYQEFSRDLLSRIKKYRETGELIDKVKNSAWVKEFFNDSIDEYSNFNEKVKNKNSLEIGSGPCGLLNDMFWLKQRNIIEPLLNGYKENQINLYGESWFDDKELNCYSHPAEILVEGLVGKIDGFIVCRNCIDHTQDWQAIMKNISQYAIAGSYFLFWADLFHLDGADDGHFNVTNDKNYFKEYVNNLGYEIQNEWDIPEYQRRCVNIGFTAIKI